MVKREYQDIEDEDQADYVIKDEPETETDGQIEEGDDETNSASSAKVNHKVKAKTTPKKKSKSSSLKEKTPSPAKSVSPHHGLPLSKLIPKRWSPTEDEILVGMMEKIIKEQIWAIVKVDGRLVSRTSYGVQYHALMLLRQGTGKGAK